MADKQHMILNKNWEKARSLVGKDMFVVNIEEKKKVKTNVSVIRSVCKLDEVGH